MMRPCIKIRTVKAVAEAASSGCLRPEKASELEQAGVKGICLYSRSRTRHFGTAPSSSIFNFCLIIRLNNNPF